MKSFVAWSCLVVPRKIRKMSSMNLFQKGIVQIKASWCLLLQLKFQSLRGASHHSAFMGNCQTISHTFYSLILPSG